MRVLQEMVQRKCAVLYTAATCIATAELMEEEEEEEKVEGKEEKGVKEGKEEGSLIEELTLTANQAAILQVHPATAPEFWALGLDGEVAGLIFIVTKRAQGKASTAQAGQEPPALRDKELVCWLYVEEVTVQEACQGRDAAT